MTREERFLDIMALIDDKFVRLAYPYGKLEDTKGEMHELTEIDVPVYKQKKKLPMKFKALIASGAAAAVAITGGILLWKNTDGTAIDPNANPNPVVTTVEDENYVPDVRNLKWGMTVEEVRAHETAAETRSNFTESNGYVFTELFYDSVELEGYEDNNVSMRLVVGYEKGLDMVEYTIETNDEEYKVYNRLYNELCEKYGKVDDAGRCAYWDVPDEGISIFLNATYQVVQYDIFPYTDTVHDDDDKESGDLWDDEEEHTAPDYTGVDVVEYTTGTPDFDVFDEYFYGKWKDENGNVLSLDYSSILGEEGYEVRLRSLHNDGDYAYICAYIHPDFNIFVIPMSDTSKLYRYLIPETLDNYRDADVKQKPRDEYDMLYTKTDEEPVETDKFGSFGMARLELSGRIIECGPNDYAPESWNTLGHKNWATQGEPIDTSLDCERILLDRAETLQELYTDYLNNNSHPAFTLEPYTGGDFYDAGKVISDDMHTYADFKAKFADSIDGWYFDALNTQSPRMLDIDGELYFSESMSGVLGINESWYIGYDVFDNKIVGHFAQLGWGGEGDNYGVDEPDFLNDKNSYNFYDIIVQNIGGKYVITDCRNTDPQRNYISVAREHGMFWNCGVVDRSLITNERVMPAEYTPKRTGTSGLTEEEILQVQNTLMEFGDLVNAYVDCKKVAFSEEKYFTTQEYSEYLEKNVDMYWFFIIDEEINTMAKLRGKLSPAMTEKMIDSIGLGSMYLEPDGSLYLSEYAGVSGSLLGTDRVYITSAEYDGADTLVLHMHAFGLGENWGIDEDRSEDFTVTMKKENGIFKVDECGLGAMDYIAWRYNGAYDVF